MSSNSKRLLAIRPGGIGDCILSFPAIEHLRSRCGYLEVWVPRAVVSIVRFADRARAISATGLDQFGIPGLAPPAPLIDSLRGFDQIVSWYGSNRDEFRDAIADLGLPAEYHAALPPNDCLLHAADFFSGQVGASLGATPRIDVEAPLEKRAFVAIHPFSGSAKKNWPLERFDELAAASGLPAEWCATVEQLPLLGQRQPVHVFEDLMELARWLASAQLYVGNDSGITHLAAAVGTPVKALFKATDPRVWGPREWDRPPGLSSPVEWS